MITRIGRALRRKGHAREQTPSKLEDFPALGAHRDRMETDEAVRTALSRQGMKPQGES